MANDRSFFDLYAQRFARVTGAGWGDVCIRTDAALPAVILAVSFDGETRAAEALLAPGTALDLALRLVAACQSLAEGQADRTNPSM